MICEYQRDLREIFFAQALRPSHEPTSTQTPQTHS